MRHHVDNVRLRSIIVTNEASENESDSMEDDQESTIEQQQQTYQGYNILHRLQVHHLTLIFIIHNFYISTLYLYTYIYTYMNCSSQLLLMIMLFY